jgi:hypothetical protein
MLDRELEEFAQVLVKNVRDEAIRACDQMLQQEGRTATAKRWRVSRELPPDEFAKVLIADVVDETLVCLLDAIDQELLRLSFTTSDGTSLDLTTVATVSGELTGWYAGGGGGGWCERFSKERYIDDLADLKDFFNKPPDVEGR